MWEERESVARNETENKTNLIYSKRCNKIRKCRKHIEIRITKR